MEGWSPYLPSCSGLYGLAIGAGFWHRGGSILFTRKKIKEIPFFFFVEQPPDKPIILRL